VIGIDIVDVSRIAALAESHGERFLRKVFTDEEIAYASGKRRVFESFAGRFAAKEAFMKARGKRLPWREIEVLSAERGKPVIRYQGTEFAGVSISHEKAYAVAVVTIEKEVKF
jgi:holo-[acyl-carrier protein] synthase